MLTPAQRASGEDPDERAVIRGRPRRLALAGAPAARTAPVAPADPWRDALLRLTGDAVCGLDGAGRITYANPGFAVLLRREGERLEGRTLHELVHHDDDETAHPAQACPFATGLRYAASEIDAGFRRGDGSRVTVSSRRVPIEGAPDGTRELVALRDASASRTAAMLLARSLEQVEALDAERDGLRRLLTDAGERERRRLAGVLHDDPIATLDALALRMSLADGLDDDVEYRRRFADTEGEIRAVAGRLRRIMSDLIDAPGSLDLPGRIEAFCAAEFASGATACEVDGAASGLSPDLALLAYRLVQEAVRNVRKHAHASRVRVSLAVGDDALCVEVTDDGVGMGNLGGAGCGSPHPTHAGLRLLRERAAAVGGTVGFRPGLGGRGTSVELTLPLEGKELP